jgi:hypothetical protein
MAKDSKAIDLGTLQTQYNAAKRQWEADAKVLARAQESAERSKRVLGEAHEALREAARTVLA